MAIIANIVFINYLAAANEGDFDLVAAHQILALDHMMFIGVLTNAIFAMLVVATVDDVAVARLDTVVFAGMNVGAGRVRGQPPRRGDVAEQVATPLMGMAIPLAWWSTPCASARTRPWA